MEDEADHFDLLRLSLRKYSHQFIHATSFAQAKAAVQMAIFDVVLLDLGLPDAVGDDVVDWLRAHHPKIAIVVTSGREESQVAEGLLLRGVQDFVPKAGGLEPARLERELRFAALRQRAASG